jgi:Fe-S oxidoreductase
MFTIKSLVVLAFLALTAFLVARRFQELFALTTAADPKERAPRTDRISERIKAVFVYVFGQKKVLDYRGGGVMHVFYFYGFIILTLGTIEMFVQGVINGFEYYWLFGKAFQDAVLTAIDWMSVLVLVALGISMYRRVIRPRSFLKNSGEAFLILGLIFGLVSTYFLMLAFRIEQALIAGETLPWSLPVSRVVHDWIQPFCSTGSCAYLAHETFWWIHLLIVLFFGVFVLYSKHLHIVFAAPNIFLRSFLPKGRMTPLNFEDENAMQFGAGKAVDYTWKDVVDSLACTHCGRCTNECPANFTGKPLDPQKIVHDVHHAIEDQKELSKELSALRKSDPDKFWEKREEMKSIVEYSTPDELWACTSCMACMEWCPVFIEQVPKIMDARRSLVMMEADFPEEMGTTFKNLETNYNPWSFGHDQREDWAQDLNIRFMRNLGDGERPEWLYWVGCAGSFDARNKQVSTAMVKILQAAGVDFAIFGNEEKCTGDPARRMGNEYLAQTLIQENVETFKKYDIQKVVTTCPHCFNTLKNEYPDFGVKLEVIHHTQFIQDLMAKNKLKLSGQAEEQITFHDPCYLGRWNDEYDAPRDVLNSTAKTATKEMERNKKSSFCCGGGGGRMFMEETIGKRINTERTEEALRTGADKIASSCPFCLTMMSDGVKEKEGDQPKTQTQDIAEIVAAQL